MSGREFFDSNVLVYTDDDDAPDKKRVALDLIEASLTARTASLSTQVLQEYFVASTRKLGVDAALARRKVALFGRMHVKTVEMSDVLAAIDLHQTGSMSFWDALVVQSALASNCTTLFSEDLQDGRTIGSLTIRNPFAG